MRPPPATDDEGQWTRVQPKKGRSRRPRPTHDRREMAAPPNPAPQLDLQQLIQDHDRISAAWRASPAHAKLRDVIRANLASHVTLTKAVCLAVGSFDPIPERHANKRTAHVQLEAFRAVVEILGLRDSNIPSPHLGASRAPQADPHPSFSRGTPRLSHSLRHPRAGL